jgi:hypothetical protein
MDSILNDLLKQSNQNFNLNIWNNSNQNLSFLHFPSERIKIINSQVNSGSQARFWLARETTENPIIFIDDDLALMPDFVEYNYEQYLKYGRNTILGWYTRRFNNEEYWDSIMLDSSRFSGVNVDYIGTGGMILDRWIIDQEETLQNIPDQYKLAEDLYLSYIARTKYKMNLVMIQKKCDYVADGNDQFSGLIQYKRAAFRSLRKAGWQLLKDGI